MSCLCQWKLLLQLANDKGRGEGEGMLESSERAGKCSESRDWMYCLWAVKEESWLILYWSILHWTCSWREQVIRRCCVVADTGSGWWGRIARWLDKNGCSDDGNCKEGVWCDLWMEERGQGDLVLDWGHTGSLRKKLAEKEQDSQGFKESRQEYWEVMCTVRKDWRKHGQQVRVVNDRDRNVLTREEKKVREK